MAQTFQPEPAAEPVEAPEPQPRVTVGPIAPARSEKARKQAVRRTRVVIRRVGPLSVLKFSLIFYSCVFLIVFIGLLFLWAIMGALGVEEQLAIAIGKLFSGAGEDFRINSAWVFVRIFATGVGMVVVWSLINVIASLLYNLISDVVGGVEITLAEKR